MTTLREEALRALLANWVRRNEVLVHPGMTTLWDVAVDDLCSIADNFESGSPTNERSDSWLLVERDADSVYRTAIAEGHTDAEAHGAAMDEIRAHWKCRASAAPTEPEGDDGERCDGCGAPATTHDADDVPLCKPCMKALLDDIAAVTRAVRAADKTFDRVGGSSRHWVRDFFLPALASGGVRVVSAPAAPPAGRDAATIEACAKVCDEEIEACRLDERQSLDDDSRRSWVASQVTARLLASRLRSLAVSGLGEEKGE